MKWFSMLTVGLISLCSMGFAQNNKVVEKGPLKEILTQYFPTTDVPVLVPYVVPLGSVVTIWKGGFALSADDLSIRIKKSGSYSCMFTIDTVSTVPSTAPYIVNFEFSRDGVSDWTMIEQFFGGPNSNAPFSQFSFNLSSSGFVRLRIFAIGTTDLFLKADPVIPAVSMMITKDRV